MSSRPATPCEARNSTEDLGSASDGGCVPPDYRKALKVHFDELYPHLVRHLTRSSIDARPITRQKISQATEEQLWELSTDVYDEFMRRMSLQGAKFLPAQEGYHPKRNAARQKLASLPDERFEVLCGDVFQEISRRYPEFYDCESSDSSSEMGLALSCWLMRQEFPRGLQRARFPNKLRATAPAYSAAYQAVEEKPVVAYQDGSELGTTHSVVTDSDHSEETLIASISQSEKPRQTTPSRRQRGKYCSLRPAWLQRLWKVLYHRPQTTARAQNEVKEGSQPAADSSRRQKLCLVGRLGLALHSLSCFVKPRLPPE
ncbi:hypothetical protein PLEOSDRAFT_153712 [Pleurotus ostreatus PC15]|uniref:GIT Spa2 homology (SHD) domain-containing protein n=1 Tax=Pleurotus ostreatus (strain PC15) TaxID=1137138 RepID=A0A067P035_PLEO1|nr:hypothetical protein PLEOSDRAFT_153712 [Pleurotus ostreatus PC15]